MAKEKVYEVTWTVTFSRTVKATSKTEALILSDEMGEINAQFMGTEPKAKIVTGGA
jgi:hypothetical protein